MNTIAFSVLSLPVPRAGLLGMVVLDLQHQPLGDGERQGDLESKFSLSYMKPQHCTGDSHLNWERYIPSLK